MRFFLKIAAVVLSMPSTIVVMFALGVATGWVIFFSTTAVILAALTVEALVTWALFKKVV